MYNQIHEKIVDGIFACLILSLLFKYIPKLFWITTMGGCFGRDLWIYPLILGIIYSFYYQWKFGSLFVKWKKFICFMSGYISVLVLSLLIGLFFYPYYDLIINGPAIQIEKLPRVMQLLNQMGMYPEKETVLKFWIFARPIKGIFLDSIYTFGGAYMIYCWYYKRPFHVMNILGKTVSVSLIIVAGYGLVDVLYQAGFLWAQNFLSILNPLIHSINDGADWSPRLFWGAQVRSLFLEPSYFGIYMAFAFPLLWMQFSKATSRRRLAYGILVLILAFELFMSQSRTAIALILAELLLCVVLILIKRNKSLLLLMGIVVIEFGLAFCGTLYFMNNVQVPVKGIGDPTPLATKKIELVAQKNTQEKVGKDQIKKNLGKVDAPTNANVTAEKYINESLGTLVKENKNSAHNGSNQTRFTMMKTNLYIGSEHPVLGVGYSLRQGYLHQVFENSKNPELQKFNRQIDKLGILRAGYPDLGDYCGRFAETGLIGIALFLWPMVSLLKCWAKCIFKYTTDEQLSIYLFTAVSFIGVAASGLGDSLNITWCYWLMLGIGYVICFGKCIGLKKGKQEKL